MKNKELVILIAVLVILILVAGGILAYKLIVKKPIETANIDTVQNIEENNEEEEESKEMVVPQKQVEIFKGDSRPIAIMIDNQKNAWPQINLSQAYLIYEIIVEGGETRLMALFKGKDLEQVGPIRSSRHYFLDYALENDAIYVHHGWSPQAQADIVSLGVNNINGISESSTSFWRIKAKSAPHNMVTSTEKLNQIISKKGYKTTSSKKSVLNYVSDEVDLSEKYKSETENASTETKSGNVINASSVTIPHSKLQTVKYQYNPETKLYTRYARGKVQTDYATKKEMTTKNVIITICDNYTLQDTENKGRQGLRNIGTFDGYYITNGKAIKIKCTKSARNAQTVYKDLEGNEIEVNDGNTFINICPPDAKLKFE